MEDEQYQKIKKALIKLRDENAALKMEIDELKKQQQKKSIKRDELDDWFKEEKDEKEG